MKRKTKFSITATSTNLFEDLGVENPEGTHHLKADLVRCIAARMSELGFKSQKDAGKRLGIGQPKVSKLLSGHFSEYSVDTLMGFMQKLDLDVTITPRTVKPGTAQIHVSA